MKIVDKEMFMVAQNFAEFAVEFQSEEHWMCAREYLKMAYGVY